MSAFVYILRCSDGSYYVGSTSGSLEKRLAEHEAGAFDGYTSHRRPVSLVFQQAFERSGELVRGGDRKFAAGSVLPEIMPVERNGSDADGFALVRPLDAPDGEDGPIFRLIGEAADELGPGERALARLIRRDSGEIEAEIVRRIDTTANRVVGVFRRSRDGGVI